MDSFLRDDQKVSLSLSIEADAMHSTGHSVGLLNDAARDTFNALSLNGMVCQTSHHYRLSAIISFIVCLYFGIGSQRSSTTHDVLFVIC